MKQKILLGVTSTVSSILTKKIVQSYLDEGFDVSVVLTEKAKTFVHEIDLKHSTRVKIYDDATEWTGAMYQKGNDVPHIDLRDEHSALVVICSANTLGKIAFGLCDNLLTSIARAWDFNKPFILAPAMNTLMWEHPATQKHIQEFLSFSENNEIVWPQSKMLACGVKGMGALANISDIVSRTKQLLTWRFPLDVCHGVPVNPHPGAFAFPRRGNKHTGIDLYTDLGAHVRAVEDGTVVGTEHFTGEWDNSPWWNNTDCVLVKGATGVVNYGEIEVDQSIKIGNKVKKGDILGTVMRVIKEGRDHYEIDGWRPTMLHLELYDHYVISASHGFEESILKDATPYVLSADKGFMNPTAGEKAPVVTYDKYTLESKGEIKK